VALFTLRLNDLQSKSHGEKLIFLSMEELYRIFVDINLPNFED
jgi:hypothetical protein